MNNYYIQDAPFLVMETVETPQYKVEVPTIDGFKDVSDLFRGMVGNIPLVKNNNATIINDNPEGVNHSSYGITSPSTEDMSQISFEQLIKLENLPIQITSGHRPGARTVKGKVSWHSKKDLFGNSMAYDFAPTSGRSLKDFDDLLNNMYSNPRVVAWLVSHNSGIIEERPGDGTGAKGLLLHMGPDLLALSHSKKRGVVYAQLGYKFELAPFQVMDTVETPKVEVPSLYSDNGFEDISEWATGINLEGVPIVKNNNRQIINDNPSESVGTAPTLITTSTLAPPLLVSGSSGLNAKIVVDTLMSRLGLTKDLAAGIAGVMMAESDISPSNYNRSEKAGKSKSKANGTGYGAGILLWSMGRKELALRLIGKSGRIEDLPLEDLLEIVIRELEGPYKASLAGIRASKSAREAAATMYCHNVGGFSSSVSPATEYELDKFRKKYKTIDRALNFAEQFRNV